MLGVRISRIMRDKAWRSRRSDAGRTLYHRRADTPHNPILGSCHVEPSAYVICAALNHSRPSRGGVFANRCPKPIRCTSVARLFLSVQIVAISLQAFPIGFPTIHYLRLLYMTLMNDPTIRLAFKSRVSGLRPRVSISATLSTGLFIYILAYEIVAAT
jgi:hypothetical protein